MDPTANLEEQLKLALELVENDLPNEVLDHDATRLAALVLALNEWIQKGGSLPIQWQRLENGDQG